MGFYNDNEKMMTLKERQEGLWSTLNVEEVEIETNSIRKWAGPKPIIYDFSKPTSHKTKLIIV